MYSEPQYSFATDLPDPTYDRQFYDGVPLKRLIAWVIDVLVIGVFSLIATTTMGVLTLGIGFVFLPAIFFLVTFFYRWLTISMHSATWGMRFMGIELRTQSGDRLSPIVAAFHTGLFMFLMATLIGWILTMISIVGTRYHQGIPDLILGTTAINSPLD